MLWICKSGRNLSNLQKNKDVDNEFLLIYILSEQ